MKGFRCTPTSAELQAVPTGTTVEAGALITRQRLHPALTIREAEVSPGFSDMCCARWRVRSRVTLALRPPVRRALGAGDADTWGVVMRCGSRNPVDDGHRTSGRGALEPAAW